MEQSNSPLFSTVITTYILILLYFPSHFIQIISSPVLNFATVLLLCFLKFSSLHSSQHHPNSTKTPQQHNKLQKQQPHHPNCDDHDSSYTNQTNRDRIDSFIEWDVRAPLEIIYEAYEGEEDSDDDGRSDEVLMEKRVMGIERYASLSTCYPESESDSSSDGDFAVIGNWDSPERMGFIWEEEEGREGLIEIELDGKRREDDFGGEEDNLIEIDINMMANDAFFGSC